MRRHPLSLRLNVTLVTSSVTITFRHRVADGIMNPEKMPDAGTICTGWSRSDRGLITAPFHSSLYLRLPESTRKAIFTGSLCSLLE